MSVKKNVISAEDKLAAALVPAEEQPYQVPENWCWTTIGNLNAYTSKSVDPSESPEEIYELYSVPSSSSNYPEIIVGKEIGSTKQSVIKGDVLLCKINPRINRVWKVSDFTSHSSIASSEWVIIRNNHLDPDFLMHCFRSPYFREYMLQNVSGMGGSLMRAQPKYVQTYPVPLSPLPEQRRIVSHIESLFAQLDEAKERAQAVIDSYEGRKASILHRAFTGELTAQLAQQRVAEWQSVSLKDVVAGFKYGTSEKSDYANSGLPVLRIPNVGDGIIDFSDIKYLEGDTDTGNYVRENDVLIIRSNGSRDLVGKCAIVPSTEQQYAYASFLIKIIPSAKVLPDYLVLFLNSADARAQMFAKAKSSAGIHNINSKELGAIQMPLPEAWEQQEIVRIANELIKKESAAKAAAEQAIAQIETMKKSILARAFRGELGTNDPNDEPAIELLKRSLLAKA